MECLSCYEIFDEALHLPLNLECGHTFCRSCVAEITRDSTKLAQCSVCRRNLSSFISVEQLPRNYHALELAKSLREKQNFFEFCQTHSNEPERFFCSTCKKGICASCIGQHSKHIIVSQEFSPSVVKERLLNMKKWGKEEAKRLAIRATYANDKLSVLKASSAREMEKANEMTSQVLNRLSEEKDSTIKVFNEYTDQRIAELKSTLNQISSQIKELSDIKEEVDLIENRIRDVKGSSKEQWIIDQVDSIERRLSEVLESLVAPKEIAESLKVEFNAKYEEGLARLATINKETTEHTVILLSDSSTVVTYEVESREWSSVKLKGDCRPSSFCTAHVLGDHAVLVGGSLSSEVQKLDFRSLDLKVVGRLLEARGEHASTLFENQIFIFGGFNRETNRFLNTCEVFSLDDFKSRPVAPMLHARSGHFSVQHQGAVFVLGGFEGESRNRNIERFDLKQRTWSVLSLRLPFGLAYSGIAPSFEGRFLIFGGSSGEDEFSKAILELDLNTMEINKISNLLSGRNIRHKAILFEDRIFLFGGKGSSGEIFNFFEEKIQELPRKERGAGGESWESWIAILCVNFPKHLRIIDADFNTDSDHFGLSNMIGLNDNSDFSMD